jgi:D-sedoheptulose 7-phosphate isomerase
MMSPYEQQIIKTLTESRDFLERFIADGHNIAQISRAADLMIGCLRQGNSLYSCGNGGSMSDAMHFAEELTGRYRGDRPGLSATAISDPGHISCVANDFGYEQVFSRYLQARARAGDCLLAISTSGRSANVLAAAKYARQSGISVISLTGAAQSPLSEFSDADISAGTNQYADRIQEVHIKVIHTLIELIEREFFPQNY